MPSIPLLPVHLDGFILFGFVTVLGLVGGELIKRFSFIPVISGYILIGYFVGPDKLGIINQTLLTDINFFIDISLGFILFNLGRHLDFRWLYHDPSLLRMAVAESCLTFGVMYVLLSFLGQSWLLALFGSIIAITTSPAIVMTVAHDLTSHGPVTRRTLMLTSLSSLFALLLFNFALPLTQIHSYTTSENITHSLYRSLGSILLGAVLFLIIKALSYLTKKNKESQFILFVGIIIMTIGLTNVLYVSTMLSLFSIGAFARNCDYDHTLIDIDFTLVARMLILVLFVIMGANLHFTGLWQDALIVIAFIIVRSASKFLGFFSSTSGSLLTKKQVLAICLAVTPMADVAFGMSNTLISFNATLGNQLLLIISSVVTILMFLGPIATQFAFMMSKETESKQNVRGTT